MIPLFDHEETLRFHNGHSYAEINTLLCGVLYGARTTNGFLKEESVGGTPFQKLENSVAALRLPNNSSDDN